MVQSVPFGIRSKRTAIDLDEPKSGALDQPYSNLLSHRLCNRYRHMKLEGAAAESATGDGGGPGEFGGVTHRVGGPCIHCRT